MAASEPSVQHADGVSGGMSFRPLGDDDLPMLHGWLNEPGVRTWWEGDDVSWEGVVADYSGATRSEPAVEHYVALLDGRPVGWIQCYPVASSPTEAEPWWAHGIDRDAAGIDYLIGSPSDRGRGLGTAVIEAFVRDIVFGRHPGWTQACADPSAANEASWRALERAGFRHIADLVDDAHGQSRLMVIDRPRQELVVAADDPRAADVRDLLAFHLALAREVTPPGHVHALDIDGLLDPAVTFVSARRDGALLGVGALRRLDDSHGEIKSMHVRSTARGAGIGRAIVDHLLALAVTRGHRRVSLETGTNEAFGPARALYASVGFVPCEPFGSYTRNPYSTCMTIELDRRGENRNTTRSESWR